MFAEILRFKEIGKRMPKKEMKKMKTEPPFLSALHAQNDTTNLFDYKLGESPETISSTFLLKLLTVPFNKLLRSCLPSDKLVNYHV